MNGTALQSITARIIQANGQSLTVTRGPGTQGGGVTTRSVYFLPQPLDATTAANLLLEAGQNAGDANPHDFECAGNSDVAKNDLIGPYDDFLWRVFKVTGSPMGGVRPALHCYAVGETAV